MRQIKFRGKRIDNGGWVYGWYVLDPKGNHRIYWQPFAGATSNTYHFVLPETVGQYTGLNDIKGNEIYEGDIILIINRLKLAVVKYESDYGGFIAEWGYSKNQHHVRLDCDEAGEGDVKGNVYDNTTTLVAL